MSQVELFNQLPACKMTEVEITYKNSVPFDQMRKVSCSSDAAQYFRETWTDRMEYVEEFRILCLNRANKVLGWACISRGGMTSTVADPKVIFQIALKTCASSIILGHNHPSGNTKPSESDIRLTNKLKKAGSSLDLPVIDHLIITADSYFSFADEGML